VIHLSMPMDSRKSLNGIAALLSIRPMQKTGMENSRNATPVAE